MMASWQLIWRAFSERAGESRTAACCAWIFRATMVRPIPALLVNSLRAHEEMSRDFRFDAELLSDNLHIPLTAMMGRMVTISMVRDDASLRHFNGYVGEFRLLRSDGGFAFYQMVLQPWLAFSRLRMDNVSFHGRTVIDISETTFDHYLQRDWQNRLHEEKAILTCANQHNETDYNHLHRRWEDQGIHYWYEHRADGHTLCLGDNTWLTDSIDPSDRHASDADEMVFRSGAGSLEGDGIRDWQAIRKIASGSLTLASFNYKHPYASRASGYAPRTGRCQRAARVFAGCGCGRWVRHAETVSGLCLPHRRWPCAHRALQ
ncbi:type VI secretion system Vgr family protein [Janthinobacterium sp. GB4P2]|uniref:type VI secretion system Vgr family protein n=1 Tax=Janthinobacterium sp. GB4P2 TaxID=3424189 RepID=UPI003F1FAF5B